MGVLSLIAEKHKEWIEVCKVFGVNDYPEDIVQEMYISLADSNINVNESNYKGYVFITLRNLCYQKHNKKRYNVEIKDNLTADNKWADDNLNCFDILELINKLPNFERKVLDLHKLQGFTLCEIEKNTGISRMKMSRAKTKAINKLKKHLIDG